MTAQGLSPALAGALAEVVPVGDAIALAGVAALIVATAFQLRVAAVMGWPPRGGRTGRPVDGPRATLRGEHVVRPADVRSDASRMCD